MSKFSTLAKDLRTTTVFIQGARKDDNENAVAGIIFQNYDDDTKLVYDMAKINVVDHFGDANNNGLGDIVVDTQVPESMRVFYDGRVAIGPPGTSSNDALSVNGGITLTGPITFFNSNGEFIGNIQPNSSNVISVAGKQPIFVPFTIKLQQSIAPNWTVIATASNVSSNIYATTYLDTVKQGQSYDLRVFDPFRNVEIGSVLVSLSNVIPETFTFQNVTNIPLAEIHAKINSNNSLTSLILDRALYVAV